MLSTFVQILRENWEMRRQTWHLALTDLVKTYRGAALGWFWLFARPAMYIFVFWFTLSLGMRSGKPVDGKPYLLWLASGVLPWFLMQSMISTGGDVYRRYSYLVNRIRFPLSVISTFYVLSLMIILTAELLIITGACVVFQIPLTIKVLQWPLLLLIMFVFWTAFSIACSPLSAMSKDFANLLRTLSTPLFWISGIIFHLDTLPIEIQRVMWINPVAWFVQAFRDCFVYDEWIWCNHGETVVFAVVFVAVILLAVRNYRRLREEVPDVL